MIGILERDRRGSAICYTLRIPTQLRPQAYKGKSLVDFEEESVDLETDEVITRPRPAPPHLSAIGPSASA
jgi:hypothetical protein